MTKEETVTRFATMTTAGVLVLGLAAATAQALPLASSAAGLDAAANEKPVASRTSMLAIASAARGRWKNGVAWWDGIATSAKPAAR
jgi:hypothetical protein